ncbi:hypothetical protein DPMN_149283, partial [Dreissena polymorpha]
LASDADYQNIYTRMADTFLQAIPQKVIENTSLGACARFCATEVEFECQSFDIDNQNRECHLHNHTHRDPTVGLKHALGFDHYRTAYERLFNRIPNHVITLQHNRNIRGLSVEECARRCVLEMTFRCQGFDFEEQRRSCWLTEKRVYDVSGLKRRPNVDFYERKSNGAMSRFINYGRGALQTLEGFQTYGKIMLGVNLDACAQLCLAETSFPCASFDYVFVESSCQLSQYIAANVYGIRTDFDPGYEVMHYELIGEFLNYFYPTPYASVPGRNDRTLRKVTPETCARKCLEEKDFVCRSFDYQITEGTCLLSHVTGSDAGGLYTPDGVAVHHFEMKPSLDCGGLLGGDWGTLASPNWPRPYPHHVNCTWTIAVQDFKVIRLVFHHINLGTQSDDLCDTDGDGLRVIETKSEGTQSFCVDNYVTELVTLTNEVRIMFTTNAHDDAQGFRIFYYAEWPCNITYTRDNGQLASRRWPAHYTPDTSCKWSLVAPPGARVWLKFTSIELEDHMASNCRTAYDKVDIYDTDNTTSTLVRTLCGNKHVKHSITSQGNNLTLVFTSDSRVQAKGFHASYTFIYATSSSTTVKTATTPMHVQPTVPLSQSASTAASITNATFYRLGISGLTNDSLPLHMNNDTISTSEQLAMVSEERDHDKDDVIKLTAIFTEPDSQYDISENDTFDLMGNTGDDIGRGFIPEVVPDADNKGPDVRAVILGVIAALVSMLIVILLTLVLVCRHYRSRQPKHRLGSNLQNLEENMSLCPDRHEDTMRFKDEDDIDDAARLPLPCDPDPVPDVEFLNPMYSHPTRVATPESDGQTQVKATNHSHLVAHNQGADSPQFSQCPQSECIIDGNSAVTISHINSRKDSVVVYRNGLTRDQINAVENGNGIRCDLSTRNCGRDEGVVVCEHSVITTADLNTAGIPGNNDGNSSMLSEEWVLNKNGQHSSRQLAFIDCFTTV